MRILYMNKKTIICGLSILFFGAAFLFKMVFAENKNEGIKVPIIMYHSVMNNSSKNCDYIIDISQLNSDISYLIEHGYTPVVTKNLVNFVYNGKPLPEKPVILTFDDGSYNNLSVVYPLIKEKNIPIIISIVGSYTQKFTDIDEANSEYGYLRRRDIKFLSATGLVEFGNHTYGYHYIDKTRVACIKPTYENEVEYNKKLSDDIISVQKMLFEETGKIPIVFTYPYGKFCNESENLVKDLGFLASYSCNEGINYITDDPNCLYLLKRFNRPAKYSTEQFMKKSNIT